MPYDEKECWDWACDYTHPLPLWWWVIVGIVTVYLVTGLVIYLW
jgi:hypothetical protein